MDVAALRVPSLRYVHASVLRQTRRLAMPPGVLPAQSPNHGEESDLHDPRPMAPRWPEPPVAAQQGHSFREIYHLSRTCNDRFLYSCRILSYLSQREGAMTEGAATAAQFQLTEVNLPVLRESQTARAAERIPGPLCRSGRR